MDPSSLAFPTQNFGWASNGRNLGPVAEQVLCIWAVILPTSKQAGKVVVKNCKTEGQASVFTGILSALLSIPLEITTEYCFDSRIRPYPGMRYTSTTPILECHMSCRPSGMPLCFKHWDNHWLYKLEIWNIGSDSSDIALPKLKGVHSELLLKLTLCRRQRKTPFVRFPVSNILISIIQATALIKASNLTGRIASRYPTCNLAPPPRVDEMKVMPKSINHQATPVYSVS